jgi:hypothetical protein
MYQIVHWFGVCLCSGSRGRGAPDTGLRVRQGPQAAGAARSEWLWQDLPHGQGRQSGTPTIILHLHHYPCRACCISGDKMQRVLAKVIFAQDIENQGVWYLSLTRTGSRPIARPVLNWKYYSEASPRLFSISSLGVRKCGTPTLLLYYNTACK